MFKLQNEELLNKDRKITEPFITIAGNVGAGKSTLTRKVGEKLGLDTHYEKVDGNPYLEDFYKDKSEWGFKLQLYFLAQRFRQQSQIAESGRGNIQDRSIYEDVEIFAKQLHDTGFMTNRDFETYQELFYNMTDYLKAPDLMIFLDGSIDTVLERIASRGRDMEKTVDRGYWEGLHNRYKSWVPNYTKSPVLHVNIDEFDLIENPEHLDIICDKIREVLNLA
jgi:deoxyadenosine/deoxycytidine kinase